MPISSEQRVGDAGWRTGRVSLRGQLTLPELVDGDYFVTSLVDGIVRVYRLPVWERIESRLLARPLPAATPLIHRANYFGSVVTLKRRALTLPRLLRDILGPGAHFVVAPLDDGSFDVLGMTAVRTRLQTEK
jgi:hypothetical protein